MDSHIAPVPLDKAYRLITHGPTVLVGARHQATDDVIAAAWACALDFTPPRLTVVLDKATRTRELIEASGIFLIQVPTVAQLRLTQVVGTRSLKDDPAKLMRAGVELSDEQLMELTDALQAIIRLRRPGRAVRHPDGWVTDELRSFA